MKNTYQIFYRLDFCILVEKHTVLRFEWNFKNTNNYWHHQKKEIFLQAAFHLEQLKLSPLNTADLSVM